MNVGDHGVELCSKAIGMLEGGITQKEVATSLNVGVRSVRDGGVNTNAVRLWRLSLIWKASNFETGITNRVIKKSLGKRRQSTRKLSRRLSIRGNPISHMTIQRHLAQKLDARPYKPPKWPRVTQKIKENRSKFARDYENWSF
ncbi:hypothetical protein LOD99_1788 [Oopsacas minuta]|uniref:Transposase Tc1-like domain-containing protein n=1 Tax=Oopsacas minuta TaxID=111878 RepID=A0AAV7K4A4_9METZ|nr:hypothetical protein LOD99_1788 [Oopsacas minuta]